MVISSDIGVFMQVVEIKDPYIATIFETKFYNDKDKFISAIKELFEIKSKLEMQEYNLLKAYERGELSLGQVANILNISKSETLELLKKYDISFVNIDEEYLEEEFKAFE